MKAPGRLEVERFPMPDPGPGAVLMKVTYSGICGTDKHTYRGESRQYAGTDHERDIVREHLSHCVEIMGIETIDIGSEARAFRLRQGGDRAFVGRVGKFAEAGPAAVQRRLDGREGSLHDVADLLEGIAKNILQYDSAALSHWKMHEGP